MRQRVPRVIRRAIVMAAGLVIALTAQAQAVAIGDHFTITFTETLPTPGLVGTADITLGPGVGSLFSISAFTASSGDLCLTCGLTSQVLTGASFDSSTSGLVGHITGTFLGEGGSSHSFSLALTYLPSELWFFTDFTAGQIVQGTYTTAAASVPEPSTALLLGSALAALAVWRRRIKA
jgi:hypothetical protein